MNWRSRKGKSGLIHMLMRDHGISKRKAEKAVNRIFASMKEALARGEAVELPIGWAWLDSAPPHRGKQRLRKFRNIQDGKKFYRFVEMPKNEIRFRPHAWLIEPRPKPKKAVKPGRKPRKAKPRPAPPPPPVQTPEDEYIALYQQLVGIDPELEPTKTLMVFSNNNLNLLLQRLRRYAANGRRFATAKHLVAAIARMDRIQRDLR
jgi:nucleoid DNA-binding protein